MVPPRRAVDDEFHGLVAPSFDPIDAQGPLPHLTDLLCDMRHDHQRNALGTLCHLEQTREGCGDRPRFVIASSSSASTSLVRSGVTMSASRIKVRSSAPADWVRKDLGEQMDLLRRGHTSGAGWDR